MCPIYPDIFYSTLKSLVTVRFDLHGTFAISFVIEKFQYTV